MSIQVHELLLFSTAWHLSERVESLRSKASWEVIRQLGYATGEHSGEAATCHHQDTVPYHRPKSSWVKYVDLNIQNWKAKSWFSLWKLNIKHVSRKKPISTVLNYMFSPSIVSILLSAWHIYCQLST